MPESDLCRARASGVPASIAGRSASSAPGLARSSVSRVGSAAAAARSSASRVVAAGSRCVRPQDEHRRVGDGQPRPGGGRAGIPATRAQSRARRGGCRPTRPRCGRRARVAGAIGRAATGAAGAGTRATSVRASIRSRRSVATACEDRGHLPMRCPYAHGHEQPHGGRRPVDDWRRRCRPHAGASRRATARHRSATRTGLGRCHRRRSVDGHHRQGPLVRQAAGWLDAKERDVEGVPLRVGQTRQARPRSQSEKRSVRATEGVDAARIRAGPAAGPEPRRLGASDRSHPDGGLADAGVAVDHEAGQPAPGTLHELFDRREFGPAADDLVRHALPRC